MITAQEKDKSKPIVLIAGGAGFIGSFLCEALLLHDCRVICIDNFSTGKKENLKKCFSSENFTFYKHDLTKPFHQEIGATYIFNLSGSSQVTKNLLPLIKKNKAKFLDIRELGENKIFSFDDINERVVYVADVYGPRMSLEGKSFLVQLIKAAVLAFPLKIPGDGSKKTYPLFVSDAIYGITKAMFAVGTENESFVLASEKGISLLEFARRLQKESPRKLEIEFVTETDHLVASGTRPKVGKLNWQPKIELKEGLEQTLKFFELQKSKFLPSVKPSFPSHRGPKPKKFKKKRKIPRVWIGVCISLLIIFLPFVFLVADVFWGTINLKKAQQSLLAADLKQTRNCASRASSSFARAERRIYHFAPFFAFIGKKAIIEQGEKLFYLAKLTSEGLFRLGLVAEKTSDLVKIVFQNKTDNFVLLTADIAANLDYSYRQFSLVEAELETDQSFWQTMAILKIKDKINRWQDLLPEIRNSIFRAKKVVLLLPRLTGVDKKKTYLVLLQNNHELRPTGGFIGSFALVTFDKGKLIDFEVKDVYSADGQLKGHVEPPEALRKYLGEANWFLRDSNWDPDFSVSAKKSGWFLEKETGRVVDGVWGVNLFLAQKVLEAIGEVQVVDFEEKINASNLFERAEYYSEVGFFPGSTQKQDFLSSLTRALFEELKDSDGRVWAHLAKAFYQSLEAKDLLVWLDDSQIMTVINELGWGGKIKKASCQLTDKKERFKCLTDYLMIVEANVGVNKANYFIQRKLSHQVDFLKDGSVKKKLEINYQNNSPTEVFPGGNYKNYLRILVPFDAQLEKVLVDKKEIEKEKIDKGVLHAKSYFGFLVEVPIKETRLVEIFYHLPESVDFEAVTQYALLVQKQSGIRDEKIDFQLNTPPQMSILPFLPQTISATRPFSFSPAFDKDITLEVSLVKK